MRINVVGMISLLCFAALPFTARAEGVSSAVRRLQPSTLTFEEQAQRAWTVSEVCC